MAVATSTLILGATLAATVAGTGMQIMGSQRAAEAANRQADAQAEIANQERRAEAIRKQAAELDARRKMLEMVRNQNRARSMALSNATAQGAQYGTGLQGGYGQISGVSNTNLLGVSQNLGFGEQLFGINGNISQQRINYAQAGGDLATAQGLSSLGGSIINSMGPLSRLSGGWNGFSGSSTGSWGDPSNG